MFERKTWEEFRKTGLLWWINGLLHVFGWAICVVMEDGQAVEVYPTRTNVRGFNEKANEVGYILLSEYMAENAETLLKESKE